MMEIATVLSENSLVINLACVKKAYNTDGIYHNFFIRSKYDSADALTYYRTTSIMNDII